MRDREIIEREIYWARVDLEDSLAELKHVVQEKVDVKARARVAVARGKVRAYDAFEVGKDRARDALSRGAEASRDLAGRGMDGAFDLYGKAKDRPVLVGAIIGGVIAIGAVAYIGHRKQWW